MGNIVFAGCSYTWGQSLWYHGNFENDIHPKDGMFYGDMICPECMDYMIENRFATQVAKHFGKEARVRAKNGGSNQSILHFCNEAIDKNTELIIIQTTHFLRDKLSVTEQIEAYEKFVEKMESKDIPVRFIHWMCIDLEHEEYELIKNDNWFDGYFRENRVHSQIIKDRTILLDGDFNFWKWTELGAAIRYYSKEKYSEIEKRTIVGYFGHPETANHRDSHFSIYGHNVVAESIINYIKENKLLK
jgi:hypothetical protein